MGDLSAWIEPKVVDVPPALLKQETALVLHLIRSIRKLHYLRPEVVPSVVVFPRKVSSIAGWDAPTPPLTRACLPPS